MQAAPAAGVASLRDAHRRDLADAAARQLRDALHFDRFTACLRRPPSPVQDQA